jgi:hypothetical protein
LVLVGSIASLHISIEVLDLLLVDFVDFGHDGLGGHESGATVDTEIATRHVLRSSSLESVPDLHVEVLDVDWSARIKEFRSLSKL